MKLLTALSETLEITPLPRPPWFRYERAETWSSRSAKAPPPRAGEGARGRGYPLLRMPPRREAGVIVGHDLLEEKIVHDQVHHQHVEQIPDPLEHRALDQREAVHED